MFWFHINGTLISPKKNVLITYIKGTQNIKSPKHQVTHIVQFLVITAVAVSLFKRQQTSIQMLLEGLFFELF